MAVPAGQQHRAHLPCPPCRTLPTLTGPCHPPFILSSSCFLRQGPSVNQQEVNLQREPGGGEQRSFTTLPVHNVEQSVASGSSAPRCTAAPTLTMCLLAARLRWCRSMCVSLRTGFPPKPCLHSRGEALFYELGLEGFPCHPCTACPSTSRTWLGWRRQLDQLQPPHRFCDAAGPCGRQVGRQECPNIWIGCTPHAPCTTVSTKPFTLHAPAALLTCRINGTATCALAEHLKDIRPEGVAWHAGDHCVGQAFGGVRALRGDRAMQRWDVRSRQADVAKKFRGKRSRRTRALPACLQHHISSL